MKRKVDSITKEKIEFIDYNSYILNELLDNRIDNGIKVIDVITSIIMSDEPLDNCEKIDELKELIELNRDLISIDQKEDSDSYWLIFNVAHHVNSVITDQELNHNARERLRLYASHFKHGRFFSQNYRKFVVLGENKGNLMIKKIEA